MSENSGTTGGKKGSNRIIGIILIVIGAFNLVSLPFTPGADKLVLYLIIGVALVAGGIWFLKK